MKCSTTTLVFASLCAVLLVLPREASAAPRCSEFDLPPPQDCKYGTTLDYCRNGVCAKGPGERCGGYWWAQGECGEGTSCSCGKCSGCSPFDGSCSPVISIC